MPASSGAVGRSRSAVPPGFTAPSLAGLELAPLAFLCGLALAGLMGGAGLVAGWVGAVAVTVLLVRGLARG